MPEMTFERAKDLVARMLSYTWAAMGLGELKRIPKGVTLAELLAANDYIDKHRTIKTKTGTTTLMTCAERLIAAIYVAENYEAQDGKNDAFHPIVRIGDNVLLNAISPDPEASHA